MNSQSAKIEKELTAFIEKAVKSLAIRTTLKLYLTTPEDTGFAEANWIPQIGTKWVGLAGTREAAEEGFVDRNPQLDGIDYVDKNYKLANGIVNITNNVE